MRLPDDLVPLDDRNLPFTNDEWDEQEEDAREDAGLDDDFDDDDDDYY